MVSKAVSMPTTDVCITGTLRITSSSLLTRIANYYFLQLSFLVPLSFYRLNILFIQISFLTADHLCSAILLPASCIPSELLPSS